MSENDVVNLAPHSFYTVACARPPIVQFSSVGKQGALRNVVTTAEFVVHLAAAKLLNAVNNKDEWALHSEVISVPRPQTPRRHLVVGRLAGSRT